MDTTLTCQMTPLTFATIGLAPQPTRPCAAKYFKIIMRNNQSTGGSGQLRRQTLLLTQNHNTVRVILILKQSMVQGYILIYHQSVLKVKISLLKQRLSDKLYAWILPTFLVCIIRKLRNIQEHYSHKSTGTQLSSHIQARNHAIILGKTTIQLLHLILNLTQECQETNVYSSFYLLYLMNQENSTPLTSLILRINKCSLTPSTQTCQK